MNPAAVADDLDAFFGKLTQRVLKIADDETKDMTARIKQDRFIPYQPSPTPAGRIYNRSGDLKAALVSITSQLQDEVQSRLFVDPTNTRAQIAASVSEFGKDNITAKFGGEMAIPIHNQLDANGVRKYATVADARAVFDLFRRGNFLIEGKQGLQGQSLGAHFFLTQRVDVPAKKWAEPEVEAAFDQMDQKIVAMFDRFTQGGDAAV